MGSDKIGVMIPFEDYDKLAEDNPHVWTSLLLTHARELAPEFAADLAQQPEFSHAQLLDKNLLKGLSIGEIGVLYEYQLATSDHTSRKAAGAYFTPDDISEFMASKAQEFPAGRWLDPCCGVGNLSFHLLNAADDPVEDLGRLTLMDLNPEAVLIAKTLLCLYFDPRINTWKTMRALSGDFLEYEIEEDYVLMNPPYVGVKADDRFSSAASRDLYAYFMEKAAKTKGFISITPQSFTNASKFASLRKLLLNERSGADIYCFDNIPGCIFKGIKFGSQNSNSANSVRAAIVVSSPKHSEWKITPLLRWLRSERAELISRLDSFLAEAPLTKDIFPKVGADLLAAYESIVNTGTTRLSDDLSSTPTDYKLYVPTSPRYFTPATKRSLDRSSLATLYFHDEQTMNKWYVVLNSSVLYWWWRVMDGGMTLSLSTLHSCPLPPLVSSLSNDEIDEIVQELQVSEGANLVVKVNAGKGNESVKHPAELVEKVTRLVAPQYAEALSLTHKNSHITP